MNGQQKPPYQGQGYQGAYQAPGYQGSYQEPGYQGAYQAPGGAMYPGQQSLDVYQTLRFGPGEYPGAVMQGFQIGEEVISVPLPDWAENGQQFKYEGCGLADSATGRRGDLYVTVEIAAPAKKSSGKRFWWIGALAAVLVLALVAVFVLKGLDHGDVRIEKDRDRETGSRQEEREGSRATEDASPAVTEPIWEETDPVYEETVPAHSHSWREATCTSPMTCTGCGEVSGSARGHSWQEATYSAPRTCSVCGATEGSPLKPEPVFLNDLGVMSGHEGKIWTRGGSAPGGTYHTNKDAPGCWGDWSIPGYTAGSVCDNFGNVYSRAIFIDGKTSQDYCMEFRLDGKYTTFSGYCASPDSGSAVSQYVHNPSTAYTKYFEVYCDGRYVGSSAVMRYDRAAAYFSFDVTGVQVLKIVYPSSKGPNEIASIYDGMLS